MTHNRKADLQRKLAMASVATPPDGLADRIKNDIPNDLRFAPESARKQMRQSAMFNLRIAASIVLLVSSLYFALHLFSRAGSNANAVATFHEPASAPAPMRPANVTLPNIPPQPGSIHAQQAADLPTLPGAPPSSIGSVQPAMRLSEKKREEAVGMTAGTPAYVDTVEAPTAAPEPMIVTNAAPSPGRVAEMEGFAPERAKSDLATTAKTSAAPSIASAQAAGALAPPPPAAAPRMAEARDAAPARNFVAIEESIARGETPRNGDLDVIVRHFAAPESVPSGVRVELEASSAPLDASKRLLRVSVDAATSNGEDITLTFGDAVESHHALTGTLAPNETALYEIEFKRTATPDQMIASVKVGGVTRTIRGNDLHTWNSASTRMKRASLAAAWARTLQSRSRADAIVVRAREAHIDDLADLAERVERNR
ncbi:MAG TPA: hypothetical protein VNN25_04025 [Thermoanaerobaculia bacterium]|nr:hypothetical protein [Thermoanaerobaculia bacterium]